jgi:hypothetical protein
VAAAIDSEGAMAAAAVIYILYAVSTGNLPDLIALGAFQTQAACQSAAQAVNKDLGAGEYPKHVLCLSSDTLNEIASKNDISKQ